MVVFSCDVIVPFWIALEQEGFMQFGSGNLMQCNCDWIVLLNLSSWSVYQFPFVVAAGAVAEELFFRVGVQVIATCVFFKFFKFNYLI